MAGWHRASRPHRADHAIPCPVPRTVQRNKRAPRGQPRTTRRTPHREHHATPARRAPRLPSAPCGPRDPVPGSHRASRPHRADLAIPCPVPRTVQRSRHPPRDQPRVTRRTPHRAQPPAPTAGREARGRLAPRLPSAPCGPRDPVPGSAHRAAQQTRTTRPTPHHPTNPAPCSAPGADRRTGGPWPGSHRACRPHRADHAIPCPVPRTVQRSRHPPRGQPRTTRRTPHRAQPRRRPPDGRPVAGWHRACRREPVPVPRTVQRNRHPPRGQPRTTRPPPHRADPARGSARRDGSRRALLVVRTRPDGSGGRW